MTLASLATSVTFFGNSQREHLRPQGEFWSQTEPERLSVPVAALSLQAPTTHRMSGVDCSRGRTFSGCEYRRSCCESSPFSFERVCPCSLRMHGVLCPAAVWATQVHPRLGDT